MDNITIEKSPGYRCGDLFFPNLLAAQKHALQNLAAKDNPEMQRISCEAFADIVIENCQQVIAILTGTKPRRKRSDAGKSHAKSSRVHDGIKAIDDLAEKDRRKADNAGVTVESSSKYRNK